MQSNTWIFTSGLIGVSPVQVADLEEPCLVDALMADPQISHPGTVRAYEWYGGISITGEPSAAIPSCLTGRGAARIYMANGSKNSSVAPTVTTWRPRNNVRIMN